MKQKNYFLTLLLAGILCVPFNAGAQVTIGSGRAPSQWSLLDLCTRKQQKALHNARMSRTQRDLLMSRYHCPEDQLAARGLLIFHLDAIDYGIGCLEFWNGLQWVSLCEDRLPPPPLTTPGFTGQPFNVCYGITRTIDLGPAEGGLGAITYQWQSSPGIATPGVWTDIEGATGQTLTLTATPAGAIRVRRRATAAIYGGSVYSNYPDGWIFNVLAPLVTPHPVSVTICSGLNHTFQLGVAELEGGGNVQILYRWQYSTDGINWNLAPLPNPNNPNHGAIFTTPVLTENTYFRRQARRNSAGGFCYVYSDPALVTVAESLVVGGLRWHCRDVGAPGTFVSSPLEGGLAYIWNSNIGWTPGSSAAIPPTSTPPGHTFPTTSQTSIQNWTNDPCPPGWRLPTRAEADALRDLGGTRRSIDGIHVTVVGGSGQEVPFVRGPGGRQHIGLWLTTNDFRWTSTVAVHNLTTNPRNNPQVYKYEFSVQTANNPTLSVRRVAPFHQDATSSIASVWAMKVRCVQ